MKAAYDKQISKCAKTTVSEVSLRDTFVPIDISKVIANWLHSKFYFLSYINMNIPLGSGEESERIWWSILETK